MTGDQGHNVVSLYPSTAAGHYKVSLPPAPVPRERIEAHDTDPDPDLDLDLYPLTCSPQFPVDPPEAGSWNSGSARKPSAPSR